MAKTKPGGGKQPPQQPPTGPVLVEELPDRPEPNPEIPAPPAEDDSEEEESAAVEANAPDPRRIPPSTNLTSQQMWAFIAQYPAPHELDLYMYRLFPVIRASPPPEWTGEGKWPTYQEKLKGLVTEQTGRVVDYEWLRNVRGSGNYHLRLIDRRLKRTQNRQIAEAKIEINEWDTHPPVLNDWSELVPCEANKWIIQRLLKDKIIKRTQEGGFVAYEADPVSQQQNGANGETRMLETALRFAERAYSNNRPPPPAPAAFTGKDIVDLIGKTQAANDPQKIIDAAKGLVEIAKPAKEENPDAHLKLIIEMAKIFKPEAPPAPVAPPDPVAQLKTYADMAKTMREAFGPGEKEAEVIAQSRMNGWQEFTNGIVSAVAPGLNKMAEIFGTFMVMKMQMDLRNQQAQQPQPTQQPTPRPAAPAIQPVQTPPQPQPAPAAAPATEQQPPPEQPPMNPQQAEMQMKIHAALRAIDYAMPTLMDHLAMNPEEIDVPRGVLFAEWFWAAKLPTGLPLQPLTTGAVILQGLKQFPPEVLVQIIQMNAPAMYEALVPTPDKAETLLGFVKEFISYDPNADESEEKK